MRRGTVAVILGASALMVATGAYVVADVQDTVPGVLTLSEAHAPADAPVLAPQSGLALVDLATTEGTPVSGADIAALWAPSMAAAAEGGWTTWAIVMDAATGEVLLDEGGTSAHTPASTTKILAAHSALTHLEADARLRTGTSLDGTNVYLWGEGDLLLAAGEGDDAAINGRAGVGDLARQTVEALSAKGITEVNLFWSPNPFSGDSHLDLWETQEVSVYEGHVAAMGIDSGKIDGDSVLFQEDPAAEVAAVFAAHLADSGIVAHMSSVSAPTPVAEELGVVESATIAQQVRYMLEESDNTVADQYCRLAALAAGGESSYAGATALVAKNLEAGGVSTAGLRLDDCSGLSSSDRISGLTLAQTIRASMEPDRPALGALVRSLPWAGVNGTLDTRLHDGTAYANLQAKTGSLASVATLAGVVTTSGGRTLIFAIGNDAVPETVGAWATRLHLDAFVEGLASL